MYETLTQLVTCPREEDEAVSASIKQSTKDRYKCLLQNKDESEITALFETLILTKQQLKDNKFATKDSDPQDFVKNNSKAPTFADFVKLPKKRKGQLSLRMVAIDCEMVTRF